MRTLLFNNIPGRACDVDGCPSRWGECPRHGTATAGEAREFDGGPRGHVDACCRDCGHHVCSCPPPEPYDGPVGIAVTDPDNPTRRDFGGPFALADFGRTISVPLDDVSVGINGEVYAARADSVDEQLDQLVPPVFWPEAVRKVARPHQGQWSVSAVDAWGLEREMDAMNAIFAHRWNWDTEREIYLWGKE